MAPRALAQELAKGGFADDLPDWTTNGDVSAVSVVVNGSHNVRFEETHSDARHLWAAAAVSARRLRSPVARST